MMYFDLDELDGASCNSDPLVKKESLEIESGEDLDDSKPLPSNASDTSLSGMIMKKLRMSWRSKSQEESLEDSHEEMLKESQEVVDNDDKSREDLVAFGPETVLVADGYDGEAIQNEDDLTVEDALATGQIEL